MPAGIEAGVEITLDPVWKVETATETNFWRSERAVLEGHSSSTIQI
jgi:hypothetical protein